MAKIVVNYAGTTVTLEMGTHKKDTRATGGRIGVARLEVTREGVTYFNRNGEATALTSAKEIVKMANSMAPLTWFGEGNTDTNAQNGIAIVEDEDDESMGFDLERAASV